MQTHHHPHNPTTTPTPPMIMMERLLYNLHYKCCTYALQTTSRKSRFYAEHTILIIAICCFGALLLSHRTFVFYPSSLSSTSSTLSSSSTIDFNKISQNYTNNNHYHHHHSSSSHHHHYIPTQCLKSIPEFIADTSIIDVTHLILINDEEDNDDDNDNDESDVASTASIRRSKQSYTVIQNQNREYRNQPSVAVPHPTCTSTSSSSMGTNGECSGNEAVAASSNNNILRKNDRIMFSYAREKGYLFLSNTMLLPISTQYVYISKQDSLCFGEPFVQYLIFHLLYYILGPDTVMINWILGTFYLPSNSETDSYTHNNHHSGYIYNPRTSVVIDIEEYKQQQTHYGNVYYFSTNYRSGNSNNDDNKNHHHHWWIKRKLYELGLKFLIVIKTSFLFFITTTLVSFTLRETQGRMLQFTHTLQQQCLLSPTPNNNPHHPNDGSANQNNNDHPNVHQQLNYNAIVQLIMTHVLENVVFVPIIVGFIYFLINFYNGDKFLAFMVLTLVWVCESFSMVRYVCNR